MATISPDIIPEILCRLGVKDLLRFRCVSKPWCSLIDSPDFIKLHLSQSLNTSTHLSIVLRDCYLFSIYFDSLKADQMLNNPFSTEYIITEILGSCNGLFALFNCDEEIALWNPSTRKFHMLPVTDMEFPRDFCIRQFIVYGFGHDPISDDYKLVRMVQFYGKEDDSFDSEVKVYSLRTNSWRRIKDFPFYLLYKRAYGVLANNSLHWFVFKNPSDTHRFIAAFDLRTEEYRLVELPDYIGEGFYMCVNSIGDSLCLIVNYYEGSVVDIWMMKEYGVKESWIKMVSVNQFKPFDFVEPLAFSKNGDRALMCIDHKRFVWYDLRSKRVKTVRIEGVPSLFEAEVLVESLVPLNANVAMTNKKDHGKEKKKEHDKEKQKKKEHQEFVCFPGSGYGSD